MNLQIYYYFKYNYVPRLIPTHFNSVSDLIFCYVVTYLKTNFEIEKSSDQDNLNIYTSSMKLDMDTNYYIEIIQRLFIEIPSFF